MTGAAGFVGRRALRAAQEAGWTVTGVIRSSEPDPHVAGARMVVVEELDRGTFTPILTAATPDVILHCAGHNGRFAGPPDMDELRRANVDLTEDVLAAAGAACPAATVVTLSSAAVYAADAPLPTREDAPLLPRTYYGTTKLAAERLAHAYAEGGGHVIVARPFNVMGADEPRGSVVWRLAAQALSAPRGGRATVRLKEVASVRDFIDADDVAAALLIMSGCQEPWAVFNVCTGEGVSVARIVELAAQTWGRTIDLEVNDPHAAGTRSVGDASALRALGWRPARRLDETLALIEETFTGPHGPVAGER